MKQITIFYLDNRLLGMDSKYVHAVHPVAAFTKMPQKEEQLVLGMMKLPDGSFMHVINSAKLLGLSFPEQEGKAIVFASNGLFMGLLVQNDVKMLTVDETTIEPVSALSKIQSEYFAGTITDENGHVILMLNMDVVLAALAA